ncbi:HIT domain-containing protein [Candidatus Curtissbacteria bacterium]|nr:HIT domain-containing protein [Candidatus Curtissbacteria bacterium]
MTNKDCIFCKIVSGEITPKDPVYETQKSISFWDINPVTKTHILIVPKRHIESVMTVGKKDAVYLIDMFEVAQKIVGDKNLDAFRLAFNGGTYQHVPHLHMHLLAGGKVEWSKL